MNLNYLFNKEYYKEIKNLKSTFDGEGNMTLLRSNENERNIRECNNLLVEKIYNEENNIHDAGLYNQSFKLKTEYPGLLIGLGNSHDSKIATSNVAEIKLGFTLDYVTGLPIIPGSTVKGVLASAFKYHPLYVAELLGFSEMEGIENKIKVDYRNEIFGDEDHTDVKNRCTFFDAIIVQGKDIKGEGKILGFDNITPHINKKNPKFNGITEPIPITMLKVVPDVTFEFRFLINDNTIKGTTKTKIELFKEIIIDLGIGAKTNTGFGGMKEA